MLVAHFGSLHVRSIGNERPPVKIDCCHPGVGEEASGSPGVHRAGRQLSGLGRANMSFKTRSRVDWSKESVRYTAGENTFASSPADRPTPPWGLHRLVSGRSEFRWEPGFGERFVITCQCRSSTCEHNQKV
jgi:hypothetical protein